MRILFSSPGLKCIVLFFSAITLITSCQTNSKHQGKNIQRLGNLEEGNDFEGEMQYEFNMTKNPTTGTIPEGIYEQERAQAMAMFQAQQLTGRVSVNPYTFQGPNNLGGRTRTIAYDVRYNGTSNRIIIAGGVSGGVYKSLDDGATWVRKSPTGEHFSCTSIAQDTRPGFQDTWYYGVGEATGNSTGASGAFYSGNGVYKSTDNGETWARLASSNVSALETFTVAQDFINKIIVDPSDGNIYIACPATIRRSTDGGATWATVLSGPLSGSAQYTDIVVSSVGRLYASFGGTNDSGVDGVWASPPGITSGDPGSWTQIAGAGAGGSPAGWNSEPFYGRVVLAIAPSSENLLYALYFSGSSPACPGGAPEAELFRWNDIGGTWTDLSATMPDEAGCLSGNDPFACQSGYDLVVAVKPDAAGTIFIGGTNLYRSTDAGISWTRIGGYASPADYSIYAGSHPDIHAIVFQPTSPGTMLCGNDGGIQRTTDDLAGTVVWTPINTGYRTYQYYYVTLDPRSANDKVLGGAQDNGSTRNTGGSGTSFEMAWGGDGVSVGLSNDISGSTYEYVGSQFGYINRRTSVTALGTSTDITPIYANTVTSAGLFVTLFTLDPDNTQTLFYANDDTLYRTTSASTVDPLTWTKMTGVAAAVGTPNDITALAATRGTYSAGTASLFMGTSNGKVFRLDDPASAAAGTGPVNITGGSFPVGGYVSSIAVNPRNDDTVLVTFSSYTVTSVWWTGNANSGTPTWTNVEGGLTLPSYRSSAIAVTSVGVEYYVGTSVGLYTATGLPGSALWSQEGASEIGNAVVTSLALRPADNKLLVGTHGYGMWYTTLSLAPLPVILLSFDGHLNNNNILLNWSTSSELNSKYFDLEKSSDGSNFFSIGIINAAGNSTIQRNYSFTDRQVNEFNYYRLKQVDIDRHFVYSRTILIKDPNANQNLWIVNNPFSSFIDIRFAKTPQQKIQVELLNVSGSKIYSREFAIANHIRFDLSAIQLSTGVYFLRTKIDGKLFTNKVVKQ